MTNAGKASPQLISGSDPVWDRLESHQGHRDRSRRLGPIPRRLTDNRSLCRPVVVASA